VPNRHNERSSFVLHEIVGKCILLVEALNDDRLEVLILIKLWRLSENIRDFGHNLSDEQGIMASIIRNNAAAFEWSLEMEKP